ncbi:CueP family metal-binding protein [Oceanobacillus polygoni]|uniref:Archaellum component FlaF (FlaF/FlaG flagellin family) n=1 Tax=Oceanobacillus polygoni TaxID=1235259 RepID=A0A9X0YUJ5_9BACI|nr:CueP family metal-binding protein [Oceanobacillus polygoni]MBP2079112.1 archaellum component FlaF (FlaF/FlaG flagellin family) [Oceanobacillus polygoni]
MRRKLVVVIGFALVVLIGYLFSVNNSNVAQKENGSKDIKELVHDYSNGNIENQSASITSHELIVTDQDGSQQTYDLPEDEFFVSIAPYMKETHPCAIHSLTGCQGEMVNEEFDVYIKDLDGNVIVDETMKSQSNGFVDLWLPRDSTYRITIAKDGKEVKSEISSFESDNTCVTTLQLAENM